MLTPPTHSKNVKFSTLVDASAGDGADAWLTHYEAAGGARGGARTSSFLSVGDPGSGHARSVVERAIERLRASDTQPWSPPAARRCARRSRERHAARSGQAVGADNVVCFAGAQNCAVRGVDVPCRAPVTRSSPLSRCIRTILATIEVSGARTAARAPATARVPPDLRALTRSDCHRARVAIFWATPNNPSGVILSEQGLDAVPRDQRPRTVGGLR